MMPANLNEESLHHVHEEIYGYANTDSAICIQLQKLDKYIQSHNGRGFKSDTFDTFEY